MSNIIPSNCNKIPPPTALASGTTFYYSPVSQTVCKHSWIGTGCPNCSLENSSDAPKALKVFIHFARLFCERYPNWVLNPSNEDPLHEVVLYHQEKKLRLIRQYPMNELEVTGLSQKEYFELSIHNAALSPITKQLIPMQEFVYWSIGADDMPEILQ